ncbi:sucrose-6-phosphate hydrolase [Vibrio sinensis]|uniref:Sucrose-6-phosphate hydrolase n=1 Tax=Vibrio sinensis TaxID=2302434 RepID=A0A3A6QR58_9VIBR|nr:sucrose-6-phosphate hydrolase [Vibrio sinensis]RJX71016.1 sucrose-6-phosphate hydrolase [Vibrio sinensis]
MNSLLNQANEILNQVNASSTDHLRPKFHITPPSGLLNDPNGFIEFDGQYHLFFQWHPFACTHGSKFWAHCTSQDLVNWDFKPTALAPDASYDKNGCYSGSAFVLGDELHLFYTGNLKDEAGERVSTQCLAKSVDAELEIYSKIGPVIHSQPQGYTAHFRDPKIWQHDGRWYCVLGAQTEALTGQVLLYSSSDAYQWNYHGPIAGEGINGLTDFGYMFECPDLFPLDGQDVLIGCPQGIKPDGFDFHNRHNNGYFVGELDYNLSQYSHGEFHPLDRGFEFYAPQTTLGKDGRRLLSAWIGIPDEDEQPTVEHDWIHALSLVRSLHLVDGRVHQRPVEEHKALRGAKSEWAAQILSSEQALTFSSENCFELSLKAEEINGLFSLRLAEAGDHFVEISFDSATGIFKLDRSHALHQDGSRESTLAYTDRLELQIFFDCSILEVFVNNGEEVFTGRVFPQQLVSNSTVSISNSCIIKELIRYDY